MRPYLDISSKSAPAYYRAPYTRADMVRRIRIQVSFCLSQRLQYIIYRSVRALKVS